MSPSPVDPRSSLRRWRAPIAFAALLVCATPIFAVNAPQDVRIEPLKDRKQPAPALFSHWEHNAQHCYSCHPTTFPQAPVRFTHQEMQEGRFCGSCHDGKTAKAVRAMKCEGCHVAR